MKKKIAVFTTGWGSEILSQFLTGMENELKNEQTDIFLFLCYPAYIDNDATVAGLARYIRASVLPIRPGKLRFVLVMQTSPGARTPSCAPRQAPQPGVVSVAPASIRS